MFRNGSDLKTIFVVIDVVLHQVQISLIFSTAVVTLTVTIYRNVDRDAGICFCKNTPGVSILHRDNKIGWQIYKVFQRKKKQQIIETKNVLNMSDRVLINLELILAWELECTEKFV